MSQEFPAGPEASPVCRSVCVLWGGRGGGGVKLSVCCNVREIFMYQVCTRYTGFVNYCRQQRYSMLNNYHQVYEFLSSAMVKGRVQAESQISLWILSHMHH